MTVAAKRIAITAAGLGLLAAGFVFFRPTPDPEAGAPRVEKPTERPDTLPSDGISPPAATAAPDRPPGTSAAPPPPAAVATATPLPAAPSGDYELNLTNEEIHALVDRRYGAFIQAQRLTPERRARLRSLLIERQQEAIEAANAAIITGLNPIRDLAIIREAIGQAEAAVDEIIRGELGEPVFTALRDFDRTPGERNAVADFGRLLAGTPEALRPEQERQVVQILRTSGGANAPGDIDGALYGGMNVRAPISEQAVVAAAAVLSPRQLEVFRQFQRRWASGQDARP